jgi:hypothetical protein
MNFFNLSKQIKPKYVDFFYIQKFINNNDNNILINTLPLNEQDCLIKKTLTPEKEVIEIQMLQDNYEYNKQIIIYGKNSIDESVDKKYNQLINLKFDNVCIYRGGMFEWSLLQDIYGESEFLTTKKIMDPLKWSIIV